MFDWNDLRYFLAVAQHGSTLAAARALKVNQSTVQRRLTEFEQRIGRPLVRRHPTGYRLTEAFVEAMNRQAVAWGLRDTRFACPAGQDESARSNAVDVLRLAARLMRDHPALAAIAGKTRLDPWEQALPNVNLLLGTVRGVDGLAAAFSPATGAHSMPQTCWK